ncbi:MAG TPA: BMP family protein [Gemmatimonadaceae bacterium]
MHIVLAATACTGGQSASEHADADSAVFKVALLTPGPVSDHAWNAGAYQGLLRIRDSLGAQISHIQVSTPADFEENFRQYGAQQYDLVFGHGFEFQDAASRVGPEFPGTVYITTSGNRVGPNVAPMVFGFEEPSYLAGIIAGTLSRTRVVGTLGGTELPPVKSSFLAFEAGVHSVDPSVKVLRSYIGNWDDASAGKEQALAQIQRGADFIFQNADAAGLGVFQAAKESKGIYVFGSNSNQNAVAPSVVIASVVIDLPHAFLTVARQVKQKHFRPRVIYLGSNTDVVKLVINPALRGMISQALQARLDSTRNAIETGRLKPPRIEFVDTTRAR